ncbi:FtsW/RodA/SpoVE family cell cycle protein [Auraticoccus sp. F435]|uniref:FtsW/RodA/SpoVE family cell cycle protein n=1 Tax=Auraticoccus cholistanensis TaxID=2656650 RepID=A0A6A9UPH9_9ACTN|nr:FtsW/RodA/SpoVE family cell cycle protein [Auraticoccus cholistanensis]MVA74786.1 FtsW/RodA/SpoVE family cell cycle protein [Auraticoccus cholistanensis]
MALLSEVPSVVMVHRKRRNVELVMILFAQAVGLGAYALIHLNQSARLPDELPVVAGLWFGLGLVAHLVVRLRLPYADPLLLPCVLLLNGLGLAMIHRIDLINEPPTSGATQQLMWTALGVALLVLTALVLRDHRPLIRFTYTLGLAGIALLLLPLLPVIGTSQFGARIWITVAGFSFQPAEVAKVVLAIAFSSYLVEKRDVLALAGWRVLGLDLPRARDLGPILLVWLASLLVLVYQRDLGTSLLFFGLFVMMLYVSTERPGWAVLGTAMFALGAGAAVLLADRVGQLAHVSVRIDSWLHPFDDIDQNGQIIAAQFGLAWGGLLGTGLGLGRPGLTPLARSDFIAAAVGEELGMAGLMAVITVYGIVVARGLRTALAAKDQFGTLLATGLSFVLALQVFIIIGGVTRLLPLTGLTTPFMSQGGSSMIANWVIVALLLVISHQTRKPAATRLEPSPDAEETQVIGRDRAGAGGRR